MGETRIAFLIQEASSSRRFPSTVLGLNKQQYAWLGRVLERFFAGSRRAAKNGGKAHVHAVQLTAWEPPGVANVTGLYASRITVTRSECK